MRKPTDGMKFTMCQMVTQSRWYGFTLGITVDNTRGGNCGGWSASTIPARASSRVIT